VIAADTNLLLRALVGDDKRQSEAARRWMTAHEAEGILIDHVVLVELVWVLRSRYRQARAEIVRVLELVLETGGVTVPESDLVSVAVEAYARGHGDFADHLLRARATALGATAVATFDEELLPLKGFVRVR
jgi:predicted nucleic-acid-binding protein